MRKRFPINPENAYCIGNGRFLSVVTISIYLSYDDAFIENHLLYWKEHKDQGRIVAVNKYCATNKNI